MQRWYILAAFALNWPLWYSVLEGNTTHFILVALLLSWSLAERGRGALAGGILGGGDGDHQSPAGDWDPIYSFLLVPISLLIAGHVPLNGATGWQIAAGVSVVLLSLPLEGLRTSNAMLGVIFERLLASAHFVGGITMLAVALKALSSANSTSTLDHLHQRASQ